MTIRTMTFRSQSATSSPLTSSASSQFQFYNVFVNNSYILFAGSLKVATSDLQEQRQQQRNNRRRELTWKQWGRSTTSLCLSSTSVPSTINRGANLVSLEAVDGNVLRIPFVNVLHCAGADITDYFNYGFTEDTWQQYCEKQRRLRIENNSGLKIFVSDFILFRIEL